MAGFLKVSVYFKGLTWDTVMGIELQELYDHFGKGVSWERFVLGSTLQSLFTFPGHYSSDETPRRWRIPCVLPAAGTTLSIPLLSLPTQPERIFCAVSDLHIKTCSVQKRELMSCLLCAILSEINRPGCMKGFCVTKGSNGKFQIMWNIVKGIGFLSNTSAVQVFLIQPFQGSEETQQASCCLANKKSLFLSPFLPSPPPPQKNKMKATPEKHTQQLSYLLSNSFSKLTLLQCFQNVPCLVTDTPRVNLLFVLPTLFSLSSPLFPG